MIRRGNSLLKNIFKIALGLLLTITIFYLVNRIFIKKNTEKYGENIIFLNSEELFIILKEDKDDYYKSFYSSDFKARNINSIDEYINKIKKSVSNFTDEDIDKIKKSILNANNKLSKISFTWFDGNKSLTIPWKLGIVNGKLYENGLPHTRNDIIILSKGKLNSYNIESLTNTLIHEKVHIYQKIYKNDILKYLSENNFKRVKKRSEDDNTRSNPDLDNWIYQDSSEKLYKAIYNNNPNSIEDIEYYPINKQSYEHPFEKMAIYIENI